MRRSARDQTKPALPTVNLLSPWVFEARATRRLRRHFALACVALILLVAAGWGIQSLRVAQAQQILTIEQAETTRLANETRVLAPVRSFVTAVEQQKRTVQEAMATEIYFSQVLDGLRTATPSGATVESAEVVLAPPPPPPPAAAPEAATEPGAEPPAQPEAAPTAAAVSPCPGPDPFNTRTVVGCITLSGTAANRRTVGDLVIRLGDSKLFVEPFISTTTTADGEEVSFTGSVGLSEKVFSQRYADLEQLIAEGGVR